MAKLQIKKSNETGKVPQPADLDWGELALNYTDGKLFYKKHGTNTVELLNPPDTNTVTRLRGTTSGTYTSGDLTLVAGTNITVTQSGSEYTIASAGGADSTKLPLTGGTLTGQLTINAVGAANSPTLRLNTSSSSAFVHTQENLAENLTTGQHAISVIGKASNTKNSGYIGYYWADNASDNNFVTIGHWGNDDLFRVYGNGNVTVGTNAILHAANYNSYAPALTGTGASGTWSISVTGSAASAASATMVSRGSGIIANVTAPGSGTYNQHVLYATNTEFGVEAALATDSLEGNKLPLVFSWRGGYDTLGGLKITGASSAQLGGNTILHAGNYNSYALPLAGGTLTGALSITDATQSTSVGTGSFITAGGVGIAKNLYVGNTIYITRAIEMSTTNNGLYHASNNMTFDSPGNDTFRIVNGRGAGAFPATLLFKSGYAGNAYGAVIGGGGEIRLQTNRGDAFVSTATATSIFDEVGGTRIVVSTGSQVQVYNNLTLMNNGSLTAGAITASDVTLTGELRGPATMYIDPAAVGDNTGTLIIRGNLQVDGTTTTINSTTVAIDDLNLQLAADAPNAAAANGAGISVAGAGATFTYASSGDKWQLNKPLEINSDDGVKVVYGGTDGQTWLRGWGLESDRGAVYIRGTGNASQTLRIGYSEGSLNWATVRVDTTTFTHNGNTIWTAGNDGSGSGLDADLLDGLDSSSYWTKSGSWWGAGFTGSRLQGVSANGGEFVLIQDHPNTGQISVLVDGAYIAGENNGFWMTPGNNWNTRYGFYWNGSQIDFRQGTAPVVFGGFVGIGGSFGSDDGNWGARLNVGGAPHARIDVRCSNDGIVTTMYSHQGQNSGKMGTMSDHRLALIANGSEYISVLTNGNVGIGTTNPGRRLVVAGTGTSNYEMQVGTGVVGQSATLDVIATHDSIGLQVWDDNNLSTPRFIVQRAGNVGINTASPTYKLDVNGTLRVMTGGTSYDSNLLFGNSQGNWASGIRTYDNSDAEMRIWHENIRGQIVLATGYVGRDATTMPTDGLFIVGDPTASPSLKVGVGYTAANLRGGAAKFAVNGIVGVGTTSPSWLLTAYAPSVPQFALQNATRSFILTNNSGDNLLSFNYGGVNRLQFDTTNQWINSGSLGIGFSPGTNPSYKLHVTGDIYANGGWLRVSGNQGLYFESWAGGWYMQDSTWIRTYSEKSVYTGSGVLATNTGGVSSGYGGASPPSGGAIISGNTGIGTSTPQYALDVYQSGIAASFGATIGSGQIAGIHFGYSESPNTAYRKSALVFERTDNHNQGGNASGKIHVLLMNGSSTSATSLAHSVVTIDSDANGTIGSVRMGVGTTTPTYTLQVNGSFAATTKSFVISHPTKPGKKLRYGSLEGPENGVYVRGRLRGTKIQLPDYWTKLVDPDSITVQLTPHGRRQDIWVTKIADNCVYVQGTTQPDCYYFIQAERVDVEKLQVELDA